MASSLEGVLASIPGYGGYVAKRQMNEREDARDLQQQSALLQIAQTMERQKKTKQAEAAMAELGPNATPEQVMAKMRPFVSPEHLFQWTQQAELKKATNDQTKQLAMQRLAQQIQRDATDLAHKARTAATAEEKFHWQKQMDLLKAYAAKQSAEIQAGRYTYDTGLSVEPFQGAVPQAAPGTPSISAAPRPASGGVGVVVVPPPTPGRPPAPLPSPTPAQATAPMPDAARAAPTAPVMPTFTGSPREQAAAKNRWLAAQAKLDLKISGGRESVYVQRMMMGANQAAKDLANVVQLPLTASTGVFGGRRQGAGLLDAGKEVLANKATGQEAQAYNAMATGFQRSLAQIESAGLMPSGSLTHQMDAVLFKEGDTNLTKLHKLAQTRQIVEAGMEVIEANPRVTPEEKAKVKEVLASIRKSVPFTHSDLIRLQVAQETSPAVTLKSVIEGGGAAPKEGDTGTSKSGKPTVFRGGRWEYR